MKLALELMMPALSPTMETGTLAKWLVAEGDLVKRGDLLAEIETDKATMEFEASDAGRVMRLMISEGTDDVAVGTVIALLSEPGEVGSDETPDGGAPAITGSAPTLVVADSAEAILSPNAPELIVRRSSRSPAESIEVSALAARIAEAKGIDLDHIKGSGPNGRIVQADLGMGPLAAPKPAMAPLPFNAAISTAAPPAGVPMQSVKICPAREAIAQRLTRSQQEVPHLYLTARCNLDALLKLRAELNVSLAGRGIKLSVDDMLVKAMALALIEVPDVNVQFGGEELYRFERADISLMVPLDGGGLITPILRDAESQSLSAIAEASRTLVAKAREGRLAPGDYEGGTASIANLSMFGIDEMIPAINPPQGLILGIAAGVEQPWKVGDGVGLATIMAATASFDHRVIDGPAGARFMDVFRELVERPILLCS